MSKKKAKDTKHVISSRPKDSVVKPGKQPEGVSRWPWAILVLAVTFFCFYNTLDNGFVNWDDDKNFLEHPAIQQLTEKNFAEATRYIFTNNVIGNYNPLANWTFALEKLWFGFEKPSYWHLNNLLLHLLGVLFVFRIGGALGLSLVGSVVLALLFGIHPMRVESVAWVTERKDVLFGSFYLIALYHYIMWVKDQKNIRWLWIYLFFIASLFSKIQAVSLPLSMLAVDYLLKGKWTKSDGVVKIPLFLLSAFFGILGIYFLREYGSIDNAESGTDFNFFQRLFIGAYSFVVYLLKFVLPYRMSPLYPYPPEIPWYYYVSMFILPVTLYALWWSYKKQYRPLFFGLTFFIVNIIFLLQILGAGQGFLADRFTYIAYLGLFFTAVYYLDCWRQQQPDKKWMITVPVLMALVMYAAMTYAQNKIWKDSGTMWTHVLKYYDKTTTPYGNRANFYRDQGMYKEALADYNATIALKDEQPQAYNSRARLFFTVAKGRDTLLMALRDYNKAIEYDPENGEFYTNRGATYARLGDIDKAIEDISTGIKYKPDHHVAYLNRSILFQQKNRVDLAIKDIDEYLELRPYDADMWYEKGRAHRILVQNEAALKAYNQAISLDASKSLYYYERSKTWFLLNNKPQAKNDFQKAMQLGFKIPAGDTYPSVLNQQ